MKTQNGKPRWIALFERGRYGDVDHWWAFDTQHVSGTPSRDRLCWTKEEAEAIAAERNAQESPLHVVTAIKSRREIGIVCSCGWSFGYARSANDPHVNRLRCDILRRQARGHHDKRSAA